MELSSDGVGRVWMQWGDDVTVRMWRARRTPVWEDKQRVSIVCVGCRKAGMLRMWVRCGEERFCGMMRV